MVVEKALHLVGNLSKHNVEAFDQFEKYQIVHWIYKCLASHHKNRKILKNTVYAIGNISFYGERFAGQIKDAPKYLLEGLVSDDPHLLLNTISAISNLLRHSSYHLQGLLDAGVFQRILTLFTTATTPEQAENMLRPIVKAAKYPKFFESYSKRALRDLMERSQQRGLLK